MISGFGCTYEFPLVVARLRKLVETTSLGQVQNTLHNLKPTLLGKFAAQLFEVVNGTMKIRLSQENIL